MSDVTLTQGDTAPSISGTLTYSDTGEPIPLEHCTVRFQMRKHTDRRYTIEGAAVIVDAIAGKVRYDLAANDLNTPGDYEAQWEITFEDQKVQTSDPVNTVTVRRQ
jgi:hypothetical protein